MVEAEELIINIGFVKALAGAVSAALERVEVVKQLGQLPEITK